MKKGLTAEPGRKMAVLNERTIVFYNPRIETERGETITGILAKNSPSARKKKP